MCTGNTFYTCMHVLNELNAGLVKSCTRTVLSTIDTRVFAGGGGEGDAIPLSWSQGTAKHATN